MIENSVWNFALRSMKILERIFQPSLQRFTQIRSTVYFFINYTKQLPL